MGQEIQQRPFAHLSAWLAFLLGISASIFANCAHAVTLHKGAGPVIVGAFWPVALLAAVETLTRVRWSRGLWWWAARFVATGGVAGVAAYISYRHTAALLGHWGEDWAGAHIAPMGVDGLMSIGAFALLSMGITAKGRVPVVSPGHSAPAANVIDTPDLAGPSVDPVPASVPAPVPAPPPVTHSPRPIKSPTPPVGQTRKPPRKRATGTTDARKRDQARQRYAESIANGTPLTGPQLAKEFGMSERWGRERMAEVRRAPIREAERAAAAANAPAAPVDDPVAAPVAV